MTNIEWFAALFGIPAGIIAFTHAGIDSYRYFNAEITDRPVYEVELFFDHIDTLGGGVLQVGSSFLFANDHTSFHSSIVTVKGAFVALDPLTLSDARFLNCQKKVASKFELYSEVPPSEVELTAIDLYQAQRLSPTSQTLNRGGRADVFSVPNKSVLNKDLVFSASSAPNFVRKETFACLAKVPQPVNLLFISHQYAENFLVEETNTIVVRCEPPST